MKKVLSFILIFLSLGVSAWAQDSLRMDFKERVGAAIINPDLKVRDKNGNMCAVVQVTGRNIASYRFKSTMLVADTFDMSNGIASLFFVADQKFTTLQVSSQKYPNKRLNLGPLKGLQLYDLVLTEVIRDKTRTMLIPTAGVGGKIMNYGGMVGIVKKWGGYVKFTYDFNTIEEAGECMDDRSIIGTNGQKAFFNGETQYSRMNATAGILWRMHQKQVGENSSKAIYMYLGGGLGTAKQYWQTTDGEWMKNTDHSYETYAIDLGLIYRYRALAISAGATTTGLKYTEANVGLGIMF